MEKNNGLFYKGKRQGGKYFAVHDWEVYNDNVLFSALRNDNFKWTVVYNGKEYGYYKDDAQVDFVKDKPAFLVWDLDDTHSVYIKKVAILKKFLTLKKFTNLM